MPPDVQFYNLREDPGEENNVQDQHSDLIEQYRKELSDIVSNGRSTAGRPQKNDGPETWEQLEWMTE